MKLALLSLVACVAAVASASPTAFVPATCIADFQGRLDPNATAADWMFTPLGDADVPCDEQCNPPAKLFCQGAGQWTYIPTGRVFPSGRLTALCNMTDQKTPAETTQVDFALRCSNCSGVQPSWPATPW